MIYLHFIRHGETIFNVYRRMQGWCDTPLTVKGEAQAESVAYGLDVLPYQKIYTSDSGRAMQTSNIIALYKGLTPIAMKGLREMFFGEMEGLDTYMGRTKDLSFRDEHGWVNNGGENMSMLQERMFASIYNILSDGVNDEEHILIISHGIAIMSLIERIDSKFFHQLDDYGGALSNVSVTTIEYDDGQFKLVDFNNTRYLENGRRIKNEKNNK